jgi:hypothetical protein
MLSPSVVKYSAVATLVFLLVLTASPSAAQEDWTNVAVSGHYTFDTKDGLLRPAKGPRGQDGYFVVGRTQDSLTKRVMVGRWFVSTEDCANEVGTFFQFDMQGNVLSQVDFAFGSESVASILAEVVCEAQQRYGSDVSNRAR